MQGQSTGRRSHGTGSLFRRGGKWYGQWYPTAGARPIKRVLGPVRKPGGKDGLTKSMAEARLRERMSDTTSVTVVERMTIAEAGKAHLDHLKTKGRKKSTLEGYESQLRVHLIPFFGESAMSRIAPRDVERFIVRRLEAGMAPKTIRNIVKHLHAIFELALRRKWVAANPCAVVDHPEDPAVDDEIRYLTHDELEALLLAAADPGRHKQETIERGVMARRLRNVDGLAWKAVGEALGCTAATAMYLYNVEQAPGPNADLHRVEQAMYLTAAMTGLRQGELIALRWMDVDFENRKIRVRQSYVRGEFGSPKSKRSSRAVPMGDRVAQDLKKLRLASYHKAPEDLVFGHPHLGKPLDRSRVTKRFKAAVARAGVGRFELVQTKSGKEELKPLLRFHDLRHTYGTRMASNGVAIRTLQEWMGHRDIKTTLIYADYAPSEHEVDLVNAAFAPPTAARG